MKTRYHISIIAILAFSTTLLYSQKSVFTFPFENSYRLPSMLSKINFEEISSTYQNYGNIYTTEITGFGDNTMEQTSYSYISDAKVVDAIRFLEFYLEEQLLLPGEEAEGKVEMSIIYFNEHSRFSVGSLIGILTIGIGTLCGVPYATNVTDVEVQASFFDLYNKATGVHRGVGRGKQAMSIYALSARKANQRALRKALDDLNSKVMDDPALASIPPR